MRSEQLGGNIFSHIYKCTLSFFCLVKSRWCDQMTKNKLTRTKSIIILQTIRISMFALTPSAKSLILFLAEFILICEMIILVIFLTLKAFSLACNILLFWFISCRIRKRLNFLWGFIPSFRRFLKDWDIYTAIHIFIFIKRMFRRWTNFGFAFCLITKCSLLGQNLRIICKKFNANLTTAFSLRWSPLISKWFCVILLLSMACI